MSTVLLGISWFDAFDGDSESEPPNAQLAEPEQTVGREENGKPLSERIACGSPRSLKNCAKAVKVVFSFVDSRASHSRTYLEA